MANQTDKSHSSLPQTNAGQVPGTANSAVTRIVVLAARAANTALHLLCTGQAQDCNKGPWQDLEFRAPDLHNDLM
jgi:hypothetical protein